MSSTPPEAKVEAPDLMLPSKREICLDKHFVSGTKVAGVSLQNYYFQRLVAKKVAFEGVDFSYTIFDTCYLRQCDFQDCKFIGCRFTASNFYGSSFSGCKFDYAVFERTIINEEILDAGFPAHENLKLKFARTLRANFQSLGDADSVNKAIKLELAATQEHLWKGWKSNESYYRNKYRGLKRAKIFLSWLTFKILDFIWGNGESLLKLGRSIVLIFASMALFDVYHMGKDGLLLTSYGESFLHVPAIFFGIKSPAEYSEFYLACIAASRLVAMGLFISILVKRFNRR
jgi:hypothetical protein